MAEYSLTTPTAVAVGASVPFNETIVRGGCCINHRAGSGIVRVHGGTPCNPRVYRASFNGNVTGVAGAIQLAMYLDGEQLPETLMSVVPAAATDVFSVHADTEILAEDGTDNISVRVVTGDTVTVNSANIVVTKED